VNVTDFYDNNDQWFIDAENLFLNPSLRLKKLNVIIGLSVTFLSSVHMVSIAYIVIVNLKGQFDPMKIIVVLKGFVIEHFYFATISLCACRRPV